MSYVIVLQTKETCQQLSTQVQQLKALLRMVQEHISSKATYTVDWKLMVSILTKT